MNAEIMRGRSNRLDTAGTNGLVVRFWAAAKADPLGHCVEK